MGTRRNNGHILYRFINVTDRKLTHVPNSINFSALISLYYSLPLKFAIGLSQ